MKSVAIAALLGAVSAIRLGDAPPYFNEPTYNQRHPSAGGFVQLQTKTTCQHAGVTGVDCMPNEELFATGMNGDENLGETITMKGDKFSYTQGQEGWNPVVVKSKPGDLPVCHGTNGPDGVNCKRADCDGTNGPKDGESGTPCTVAAPAAIPAYKTEPTAGQPYGTTGNLLHQPRPPRMVSTLPLLKSLLSQKVSSPSTQRSLEFTPPSTIRNERLFNQIKNRKRTDYR